MKIPKELFPVFRTGKIVTAEEMNAFINIVRQVLEQFGKIAEDVDEFTGEGFAVISEHVTNFNNPHEVDAEQINTYEKEIIDGKIGVKNYQSTPMTEELVYTFFDQNDPGIYVIRSTKNGFELAIKTDIDDGEEVKTHYTRLAGDGTFYTWDSVESEWEHLSFTEFVKTLADIKFELVEELPAEGESNIIYLVPNGEESEDNTKDSFVWLKEKARYERIGSTDVDLTGYVTEEMYVDMFEELLIDILLDDELEDEYILEMYLDYDGEILEGSESEDGSSPFAMKSPVSWCQVYRGEYDLYFNDKVIFENGIPNEENLYAFMAFGEPDWYGNKLGIRYDSKTFQYEADHEWRYSGIYFSLNHLCVGDWGWWQWEENPEEFGFEIIQTIKFVKNNKPASNKLQRKIDSSFSSKENIEEHIQLTNRSLIQRDTFNQSTTTESTLHHTGYLFHEKMKDIIIYFNGHPIWVFGRHNDIGQEKSGVLVSFIYNDLYIGVGESQIGNGHGFVQNGNPEGLLIKPFNDFGEDWELTVELYTSEGSVAPVIVKDKLELEDQKVDLVEYVVHNACDYDKTNKEVYVLAHRRNNTNIANRRHVVYNIITQEEVVSKPTGYTPGEFHRVFPYGVIYRNGFVYLYINKSQSDSQPAFLEKIDLKGSEPTIEINLGFNGPILNLGSEEGMRFFKMIDGLIYLQTWDDDVFRVYNTDLELQQEFTAYDLNQGGESLIHAANEDYIFIVTEEKYIYKVDRTDGSTVQVKNIEHLFPKSITCDDNHVYILTNGGVYWFPAYRLRQDRNITRLNVEDLEIEEEHNFIRGAISIGFSANTIHHLSNHDDYIVYCHGRHGTASRDFIVIYNKTTNTTEGIIKGNVRYKECLYIDGKDVVILDQNHWFDTGKLGLARIGENTSEPGLIYPIQNWNTEENKMINPGVYYTNPNIYQTNWDKFVTRYEGTQNDELIGPWFGPQRFIGMNKSGVIYEKYKMISKDHRKNFIDLMIPTSDTVSAITTNSTHLFYSVQQEGKIHAFNIRTKKIDFELNVPITSKSVWTLHASEEKLYAAALTWTGMFVFDLKTKQLELETEEDTYLFRTIVENEKFVFFAGSGSTSMGTVNRIHRYNKLDQSVTLGGNLNYNSHIYNLHIFGDVIAVFRTLRSIDFYDIETFEEISISQEILKDVRNTSANNDTHLFFHSQTDSAGQGAVVGYNVSSGIIDIQLPAFNEDVSVIEATNDYVFVGLHTPYNQVVGFNLKTKKIEFSTPQEAAQVDGIVANDTHIYYRVQSRSDIRSYRYREDNHIKSLPEKTDKLELEPVEGMPGRFLRKEDLFTANMLIGVPVRFTDGHPNTVLHNDKYYYFNTGVPRHLYCFDLKSQTLELIIPSLGTEIVGSSGLAVNDKYIAIGGGTWNNLNTHVSVYDVNTREFLFQTPQYGRRILSIVLTDTHIFYAGSSNTGANSRLHGYNLSTGTVTVDIEIPETRYVYSMAANETDLYIASYHLFGGEVETCSPKRYNFETGVLESFGNYHRIIYEISVNNKYVMISGKTWTGTAGNPPASLKIYDKDTLEFVHEIIYNLEEYEIEGLSTGITRMIHACTDTHIAIARAKPEQQTAVDIYDINSFMFIKRVNLNHEFNNSTINVRNLLMNETHVFTLRQNSLEGVFYKPPKHNRPLTTPVQRAVRDRHGNIIDEVYATKESTEYGVSEGLINHNASEDAHPHILGLINAITSGQISFVFVEELPAVGEPGVFYFVPRNETETDNVKNEYIWISETSSYELIGNTDIDLSDYVTETQLTEAINGIDLTNFITETQLTEAINGIDLSKIDEIESEIFTSFEHSFADEWEEFPEGLTFDMIKNNSDIYLNGVLIWTNGTVVQDGLDQFDLVLDEWTDYIEFHTDDFMQGFGFFDYDEFEVWEEGGFTTLLGEFEVFVEIKKTKFEELEERLEDKETRISTLEDEIDGGEF